MTQRTGIGWLGFLWMLVGAPLSAEDKIIPLLKAQTVLFTVTRDSGAIDNGSGVILCQSGELAYILTARHVLEGETQEGDAMLVLDTRIKTAMHFYKDLAPPIEEGQGQDVFAPRPLGPKLDLSLLTVRVDRPLVATAKLEPAAGQRSGSRVYAIGYRQVPEKTESWSYAEGTFRELVEVGAGTEGAVKPRLLRHTAPITEGFSGGPLFNEGGALIGLNIGGEGEGEIKHALPVEVLFEAIRGWLPGHCMGRQELMKPTAYDTYRKGMEAVSTKDWSAAECLMREALEQWPWEGGSLHLQGMRYTLYLPRYHLGLALYKEGGACSEAVMEWDRSEVQGALQADGKRFRKMRTFRQNCRNELKSELGAHGTHREHCSNGATQQLGANGDQR